MAHPLENLVKISLIDELNASFAKLQDVGNDRPELSFTENDGRSGAQLFCGARQDLPDIAFVGLEQQELDQTTRLGPTLELGGKDTGIVGNQQICRSQNIGKLQYPRVVKRGIRKLQVKKPRLVSSFQGLLSDELGRKLEVEFGEEQG